MPAWGVNHPGAKLTADDVEQLRYERVTYGVSYPRLAMQFGISPHHAWRLCRGYQRRRDAGGPLAPAVGSGGQRQAFPSRSAVRQRRFYERRKVRLLSGTASGKRGLFDLP